MKEIIKEHNARLSAMLDEKEISPLYKVVIQNAIDHEDPLQYLREAIGQNGSITGLIYYVDTHKFFDIHYNEIQELVEKWEGDTGEGLVPQNDIKNFYAWFGYEHVADDLANMLEND